MVATGRSSLRRLAQASGGSEGALLAGIGAEVPALLLFPSSILTNFCWSRAILSCSLGCLLPCDSRSIIVGSTSEDKDMSVLDCNSIENKNRNKMTFDPKVSRWEELPEQRV